VPSIVVPAGSEVCFRVRSSGRAQGRDHEYDTPDDDGEDEPEESIRVHYLIQMWPRRQSRADG